MTHEQPGTIEKFTLDANPIFVAKDTPPIIKGRVFFDRDFLTEANLELLRQSDEFYQDDELMFDPEMIGAGYCALEIIELLSARGELPDDIIYVPNIEPLQPLESYIYTKVPQLRAVLSLKGILSHSAINVQEAAHRYGGSRSNFALLFRVETDLLQSQDQVEIDLSNPPRSSITVTRDLKTD